MNLEEIEQKIQQEAAIYNSEVNPIKAPPFIIEVFKKAVLHTPAIKRKWRVETIVSATEKTVEQLTRLESRMMVNCIVEVDPSFLYRDFKDAMVKEAKVDRFMIAMNEEQAVMEGVLSAKKKQMIELAGIDLNARKPKIHKLN